MEANTKINYIMSLSEDAHDHSHTIDSGKLDIVLSGL